MVVPALADPDKLTTWDELLQPDTLAHGARPEQRVVFNGIAWNSYLAFDRQLGEDRSGPRLYFLEGALEIMTTSPEHERIKKWIGGFVEDYFLNAGIETVPRGQATLRAALKEAGAEPDESWCLLKEKEFPDLVIEVALTSGGADKLEIYRRFAIPEVWFWKRDRLEIFALRDSGAYELTPNSPLLPGLDIALLESCLRMTSWHQARLTFRSKLNKAN